MLIPSAARSDVNSDLEESANGMRMVSELLAE